MRDSLNWNDLRFLLAVARYGSLSRAARHLRVDAGTVSRRVSAIELALGVRCFERRHEGYRLTAPGLEVLEFAERVEQQVLCLDRAVEASCGRPKGRVVLTTSETVASGFVVPALVSLRAQHPGVTLELISENRVLSLARGDVDIALRLVRPEGGDLVARRVADLNFGLFASSGYLEAHGAPCCLEGLEGHALIDWVEDYSRAASAVWMRALTLQNPAVLKVNTSAERVAAAKLGLGIVLLPYLVARDTDLVAVLPETEIPGLELWLLAHPETARIPRVRAVMDFLVHQAADQAQRFTSLD